MLPTRNDNHVAEGLALFTDLFRNKKYIPGITAAWLRQLQATEGVLWDVILAKTLDGATGEALNIWGRIVNEPRNGRTDDNEYREAIRLRIRINRSKGQIVDIFEVVALSLGPTGWTYEEFNPATFEVTALNISYAKIKALAAALHQTKSIGTKALLVYSNNPGPNFVWGSTVGTVPAALGFGHTNGVPTQARYVGVVSG